MGVFPLDVIDEVDRLDERFDNVDLLFWGDGKKLELKFVKEGECVAGTLVTPLAKCFVYHDKPKRPALDLVVLQPKLIRQGGG